MLRFRALGVPVVVDTWFLFGTFFIYVIAGGGRAGAFAAVGIAVFTLFHEMGHALTARHYGCTVDIRLNFLMGWAAFSSPRPLTRAQRIIISLAGPLTGLVLGFATLTAVHVAMGSVTYGGSTHLLLLDLWSGVAWAAIMISLLNLLPLWPLDGGHVLQKLLEIVLGERRSMRAVAYVSLAASALLVIVGFLGQSDTGTIAEWRRHASYTLATGPLRSLLPALWSSVAALPGVLLQGLILLPVICGLASWQLLRQANGEDARNAWIDVQEPSGAGAPPPRYDATALAAEREGWYTGQAGSFPRGWSASPWLRAWGHLRAGDTPGARMALAGVVAGGGRWIPPEPRQPELRALVALLPDPPPIGDRRRSLDLLTILGVHGTALGVIDYATRLYAQEPDAEVLYRAAAGLVQAGEPDAAMQWLQRAVQDRPDADRLGRDPLLVSLHGRLDFQQLLSWTRQAAPVAR